MSMLGSISNLFGGDLWILLLIVLILFGSKKLPELARGAGQAIREFNKAKDEFEREITKPGAEAKPQEVKPDQKPVETVAAGTNPTEPSPPPTHPS